MVHIDEVRAQVTAAYARLGLTSWPDPHRGITSPGAEEYSQVTSPERYRIVEARASVWADALGACPGVEVEPIVLDALGGAGPGDVSSGLRLRSTRPHTLPLLLLTRQVPTEGAAGPLGVVHICVDRVSVVLAGIPDCGCDACDSGSDDLLGSIDDTIGGFVGGPSVMLRGPGWHANWRPDGGSSGGDGHGPDHDQLMQLCQPLVGGTSSAATDRQRGLRQLRLGRLEPALPLVLRGRSSDERRGAGGTDGWRFFRSVLRARLAQVPTAPPPGTATRAVAAVGNLHRPALAGCCAPSTPGSRG